MSQPKTPEFSINSSAFNVESGNQVRLLVRYLSVEMPAGSVVACHHTNWIMCGPLMRLLKKIINVNYDKGKLQSN